MINFFDHFTLPGTDLKPSRIGLGGAPLGGHGWGERDDNSALLAIKCALNLGITFFDTADVYGLGLSERLLSQALGNDRHKVVIATKGGVRWDSLGRTKRDSSPAYLSRAVDESLRRLKIDSIPLYFLHWQDGFTPIRESIEKLVDLKRVGKIQAIGLSNISISDFEDCATMDVSAIQVKGNLLEPDDLYSINNLAKLHNISVIAFSVLSDGLLSGQITEGRKFSEDDHRSRYPLFQENKMQEVLDKIEKLKAIASRVDRSIINLALRWPIDMGLSDSVLFGAKRPSQVEENLMGIDQEISFNLALELALEIPLFQRGELQSALISGEYVQKINIKKS